MKWWYYLAGLGGALNIADAIATCVEIENHLAAEANPLMAALYAYGAPVFIFVKLIAAGLFLLLAKNSDLVLARIAIVLGLLCYVGVGVWHVISFAL